MIELSKRHRELSLANAVPLAAAMCESRHCGKSGEPLPEALDFTADELLGSRELVASPFDIGRDDRAQVIEVVEKHIVHRTHARLDVARDRNVEDAQRMVTPPGDGGPNSLERDHWAWRGRRAQKYIHV